jgi:two-component system, OmpR family, response regulator VanR
VRILVVEDEDVLAQTVAEGLRDLGWAVDVANDGLDAFEKASVNAYDVIVLDRDLPGLHGDELCRRLNAAGNRARILMLTAAGALNDRVAGLMLGADDYLSKPFAFVELMARVTALSRRPATPGPTVLAAGGITVDRGTRVVQRDGRTVVLGNREFAVLCLLLEQPGRIVSAEELLERAWDENADPFTNAVRITMARLRKKLGEPWPIETVVGVGYRLNP